MKALEKAAQDREAAPAMEPGPARELSLEALAPKPGAANPRGASAGGKANEPPGLSGGSSKSSVRSDRPHADAQRHAAAVLGTRQTRQTGAVEWIRDHRLSVLGALAGLILLAYGGYVYVQIAHPTLFFKTPPSAPVVAAAPPATAGTSPPATGTGEPGRLDAAPEQTTETANSQLLVPPSVFTSRSDPQPSQSVSDSTRNSSYAAPPRPAPPVSTLPPPRSTGSTSPPPSAMAIAPQNRVAISRGDANLPRVNPAVAEAYTALEAGQYDTAERLYSQALGSEPTNVDALLGMAALATKDNRAADAQRHFLAILDVDPRHALAQSGLIALMGQSDPQAAESRLKQLLAREPSPPLYFNLGNLYAEQGQWSQAQQAYFQAHHLEPRNPDYAYNLAVGLEHLGQQKLALGFYRKAQQLASARGAANFDPARLQDRITQLASRFE